MINKRLSWLAHDIMFNWKLFVVVCIVCGIAILLGRCFAVAADCPTEPGRDTICIAFRMQIPKLAITNRVDLEVPGAGRET